MLYEHEAPPKRLNSAIVTRIKIMAHLDIAERRLPQDGRIRIKSQGKDIDIRVSTPAYSFWRKRGHAYPRPWKHCGESRSPGFSAKGVGTVPEPDSQTLWTKFWLLAQQEAEKTTTLYGSLEKINTPEKKIVTIEDPVEYQLRGVNQVHIRPQIGLTFANGLRSIVRQDPGTSS